MVFSLKKIIITFLILIVLFITSSGGDSDIIIPKDAIRFRVIANSNSEIDQAEKKKIAKKLGSDITSILKDSNSLEESRNILKNNVGYFKSVIEDTMNEDHYNSSIDINYGYNVFPQKEYKGVIYEEGEYESLVVTLGKGSGENFWCVLFPPLCLLEAEEEDTNKVEYKSLIKEVIDKYF